MSHFQNITFLNNSSEFYDNYLFVGTTLWSQITDFKHAINDIEFIDNFTIEKYNELHNSSLLFLNNIIQSNSNINIIMITHHLPSYKLINKKFLKYPDALYNQWFASNLEYLIVDNIKYWIYGHTHISNISKINNTIFLCNPVGYPGENTVNNINYNCYITT